jgi:hypothetical protein
MPDRNKALYNPVFYEGVHDAFFSSEEYSEAFEKYIDDHWDELVDEYWPHSED